MRSRGTTAMALSASARRSRLITSGRRASTAMTAEAVFAHCIIFASASRSAFSVSSTVESTHSSRCAWRRPSSICTTGPETGLNPSASEPYILPSLAPYRNHLRGLAPPACTNQPRLMANQICERKRTLSRDTPLCRMEMDERIDSQDIHTAQIYCTRAGPGKL